MHLLYSTAIGTEVIDENDHVIHGIVSDLLIDPDRGVIQALLLSVPGSSEEYALQRDDIVTWGQRVHIRSADVIGPISEVIRLQEMLQDSRSVIGQRIKTKSGVSIGTCIDVQFTSKDLRIEWIFPKKFFRKGLALPASDIVEVTERTIIVKDQEPKEETIPVEEVGEEAESAASVPATSYTGD